MLSVQNLTETKRALDMNPSAKVQTLKQNKFLPIFIKVEKVKLEFKEMNAPFIFAKVKVGDTMTHKTALGERTYTVTEVKIIHQSDWSGLSRSDYNKLLLITCITDKFDMRLSVTITEVGAG